MYLLDTCTLLWLVSQPSKLGPTVVDCLGDIKSLAFISSISAFEIGLKVRKKKLTLPLEPEDRIIIATALENKLTLLTPDSTIRNYPKVPVLW